MDRAGNIGFSDSDPSNPRFINDLGEPAKGERKPWPNVFGYYSAHIITLDEKDPEVKPDRSATGFYGTNSDGKMIVDRSGVMVVFDGPIDASSVTTDTFAVDLDEDTAATVTDVDVEKNYVFLKLADSWIPTPHRWLRSRLAARSRTWLATRRLPTSSTSSRSKTASRRS